MKIYAVIDVATAASRMSSEKLIRYVKLIRSGKTSAFVFNDRMIPIAEMRAEPQSMIFIPFIKEYTRIAYALFFRMN